MAISLSILDMKREKSKTQLHSVPSTGPGAAVALPTKAQETE